MEFFDDGYACTAGRFPKGNRYGIVTVSGGVGILMADVAAARGLEVSRLPDPAQRKIKAMLPFAGTINPLDVTGQTLNKRSEERRVGQECVRTCRFRWSESH